MYLESDIRIRKPQKTFLNNYLETSVSTVQSILKILPYILEYYYEYYVLKQSVQNSIVKETEHLLFRIKA